MGGLGRPAVHAGSTRIQRYTDVDCYLLVGAFKPSQPQRILSGLKETFIKRYIVERTNKAEIRPEEQSEKVERCWKNLWKEIQLKGP